MRSRFFTLLVLLCGFADAAVASFETKETRSAYTQALRQLHGGDLSGARASVLRVAGNASGLHFCASSLYLSANRSIYFPSGEALRFFKEANGRVSLIELQKGKVLLRWQAQAPPGRPWWKARARGVCGVKPVLPAMLSYFDQNAMPPSLQAGQVSTRGNVKTVTFNAPFDELRARGLTIFSFPRIPGEAVKLPRP